MTSRQFEKQIPKRQDMRIQYMIQTRRMQVETMYSLNPRLVLNQILYSQDVFSEFVFYFTLYVVI
jgi:hypothetical protein